jgi:hypothetical protein
MFTSLIEAERTTLYAQNQKTHDKLVAEAAAHGAVIDGWGKDARYRLYRLSCGHRQEIQSDKMRIGKFKCQTCLGDKLKQEAAVWGATPLRFFVKGKQSYGDYLLSCGDTQEIQTGDMRIGKFKCRTCLDDKLKQEAAVWGATPLRFFTKGNNSSYGEYLLSCGHTQTIQTVSMRIGEFSCQQCEETWATKPSNVYVHLIRHSGIEVIKVGVAQDIQRRADRYGLPPDAEVITLRVWPFATGLLAKQAETNVKTRFASSRVDEGRLLLSKSGYTECFCPSVTPQMLEFMTWDM